MYSPGMVLLQDQRKASACCTSLSSLVAMGVQLQIEEHRAEEMRS